VIGEEALKEPLVAGVKARKESPDAGVTGVEALKEPPEGGEPNQLSSGDFAAASPPEDLTRAEPVTEPTPSCSAGRVTCADPVTEPTSPGSACGDPVAEPTPSGLACADPVTEPTPSGLACADPVAESTPSGLAVAEPWIVPTAGFRASCGVAGSAELAPPGTVARPLAPLAAVLLVWGAGAAQTAPGDGGGGGTYSSWSLLPGGGVTGGLKPLPSDVACRSSMHPPDRRVPTAEDVGRCP
jgi:hypothetical protein